MAERFRHIYFKHPHCFWICMEVLIRLNKLRFGAVRTRYLGPKSSYGTNNLR